MLVYAKMNGVQRYDGVDLGSVEDEVEYGFQNILESMDGMIEEELAVGGT